MTVSRAPHRAVIDPQCELYDRFVRRGEQPDPFSAKRLYPALSTADALARIRRLRDKL